MIVVDAERARSLGERVLGRYGASAAEARLQADLLLEADLRGRRSHGLQRLSVLTARLECGVLVAGAVPRLEWKAGSFLAVDGGDGFGVVAVRAAIEQLVLRAADTGVAAAGIRRGGHIGMLAPHLEEICGKGLVGFIMTTSEALVHPTGGRTALLGTNPIGICVPADPEPFVLDMSTAAISAGEILARGQSGEALPPGRCVDSHGNPTTDPELARAGAISPFGGSKGYGLSLAVELLVALMSATALGTDVVGTLDTDSRATKGDLVIVLDPDAVGQVATVAAISSYLDTIRAAPRAAGIDRILIPGDRMRAERARSLRDGIRYPSALWDSLLALDDNRSAGADD